MNEIPKDGSGKPELTPDCCEVWPKIVANFGWFTFNDWPDIATMPYLPGGESKWRVNFCPACGADRRAVMISAPWAAENAKVTLEAMQAQGEAWREKKPQ